MTAPFVKANSIQTSTGQQSKSKSAHSCSECPLTLNPPSRSNVGSRPTEKIRRSIVEAMSARMPWGWGKTMTIARETSMAIHSRADRWGSRVPEDEGHIKKGYEHFHSWGKLLQQCFQQDLFFSSRDSLPLRAPCQKHNYYLSSWNRSKLTKLDEKSTRNWRRRIYPFWTTDWFHWHISQPWLV